MQHIRSTHIVFNKNIKYTYTYICVYTRMCIFFFYIRIFNRMRTDCVFTYIRLIRYDALWYTAPVQIQKVLLIILQRTVKGYVLNVSGIIMASLETFASVTIYFCRGATNNKKKTIMLYNYDYGILTSVT